jgi:hypothetical protein
MRIATALLLIAVGAILTYAVDVDVPGIRIEVLGAILFWVGVLGLVIAVALEWRATRPHHPPPPAPRDQAPTRVVRRRDR